MKTPGNLIKHQHMLLKHIEMLISCPLFYVEKNWQENFINRLVTQITKELAEYFYSKNIPQLVKNFTNSYTESKVFKYFQYFPHLLKMVWSIDIHISWYCNAKVKNLRPSGNDLSSLITLKNWYLRIVIRTSIFTLTS